jgi:ABC-type Fe3+-hydroxamate transport system substrate-binding protein
MLKRRGFLTGMAACASVQMQGVSASAETWDVLPSVKGDGDHALSIRDDLGARLVVKASMSRLVVFNRYTAEFVRALAGSEVIIGVDAATAKDRAYWPNLQAAITGEGQTQPNYEAIITVQPCSPSAQWGLGVRPTLAGALRHPGNRYHGLGCLEA